MNAVALLTLALIAAAPAIPAAAQRPIATFRGNIPQNVPPARTALVERLKSLDYDSPLTAKQLKPVIDQLEAKGYYAAASIIDRDRIWLEVVGGHADKKNDYAKQFIDTNKALPDDQDEREGVAETTRGLLMYAGPFLEENNATGLGGMEAALRGAPTTAGAKENVAAALEKRPKELADAPASNDAPLFLPEDWSSIPAAPDRAAAALDGETRRKLFELTSALTGVYSSVMLRDKTLTGKDASLLADWVRIQEVLIVANAPGAPPDDIIIQRLETLRFSQRLNAFLKSVADAVDGRLYHAGAQARVILDILRRSGVQGTLDARQENPEEYAVRMPPFDEALGLFETLDPAMIAFIAAERHDPETRTNMIFNWNGSAEIVSWASYLYGPQPVVTASRLRTYEITRLLGDFLDSQPEPEAADKAQRLLRILSRVVDPPQP